MRVVGEPQIGREKVTKVAQGWELSGGGKEGYRRGHSSGEVLACGGGEGSKVDVDRVWCLFRGF